jgi:glycerate dehydrogenase
VKGVFLDSKSVDDLSLEGLKSIFSHLDVYSSTSESDLLARISDADVIITNKVVLGRQALEATPAKLVCVVATGTNNIDLVAAKSRGITVSNCQAYGVNSVVQHTIALMLALNTRLLDYDRDAKAGAWGKSDQFCLLDYPITELSGKTLGIVGFGHLGQGVAKIAEAFGMKIIIAKRDSNDQRDGRVDMDLLLQTSDVITLHCPLTDETRDLIDRAALQAMKSTAVLINVARGGVVNEQDLADALRDGQIAGAATDVLTEEPPVNGNPLLDSRIPNLIVTPHSAWGSVESRKTIIQQTIENITAFQQGEPVRVV